MEDAGPGEDAPVDYSPERIAAEPAVAEEAPEPIDPEQMSLSACLLACVGGAAAMWAFCRLISVSPDVR